MTQQPVFIGGFRSGTTLLVNLLGLHSGIAPWFETKCLCEALRWQRVLKFPETAAFEACYSTPASPAGFSPEAVAGRMHLLLEAGFDRLSGAREHGKGVHEYYPLGHDCLRYSRKEALAALRRWDRAIARKPDHDTVTGATADLIAELGERQRRAFDRPLWVNKTPEITRFAAELREGLGPCRVVYMVRNGLDVVASAKALGWGDVALLAYNWRGLLSLTREAMRPCPGDYLELRYEDLLDDPVAVLERTGEFLGVEPEADAIVRRFVGACGSDAFERGRREAGRGLNTAEREAFDGIAGALQAELGY